MTSRSDNVQSVDFTDLQRATTELSRLTVRLAGMSGLVAGAKTVKEFDSERRKAALSRAVMRAFKAGCGSSSRAEHSARAEEQYQADMVVLRAQYAEAEKTLTDFQVIQIQIDSLRTLVSAAKRMFEDQPN